MFSILIPSWNNLSFLKLCIESIEKNSAYKHEILIHVNDGSDGTLEWVRQKGYKHTHSEENIGVCYALNGLRPLATTDYIMFMNDDMYVCPGWDTALVEEIKRIGHKMFFLSSTLIQPRPFFCKSVIAPANYGETVESFDEERLLREYATLPHGDWMGATWPPNVVHKDLWDLVGGYSIEFSFEARSTHRIVKNDGSLQFLRKWGITSGSFIRDILHRGEPFDAPKDHTLELKKDIERSRWKKVLTIFRSTKTKNLWD